MKPFDQLIGRFRRCACGSQRHVLAELGRTTIRILCGCLLWSGLTACGQTSAAVPITPKLMLGIRGWQRDLLATAPCCPYRLNG